MNKLKIIDIERSGGFTGLTKQVQINLETLSKKDSEMINRYIEKSGIQNRTTGFTGNTSLPDQFHYLIRITSDKDTQLININESEITPEIRRLIDFISEKAQKLKK